MGKKLVFFLIFLSFAAYLSGWPPIPKFFANGIGSYTEKENSEPTHFLWGVGMSLVRNENVYILITTKISSADKQKMEENNIELVMYDDGSTILRIRMRNVGMSSDVITQRVLYKISDACPNIVFDPTSARFIPRP